PANVAQDAAGNGNTAAASQFTITYAQPLTAAPVVIAPANGSLLSNGTPSYAGTAPANSTITVYVDGTPIGTTTASNGSWNLTQPVNLAEGSHTVNATARLSGQVVSPTGNTNTFTIDATPPTVTLTGPAATSVAQISLTVTFSEAVTGFSLGDVSVTNGTLNSLSGSGTTFTLTLTATASGPLTVSVLANTVQDLAGNGNLAASPFTIQYTPNNAPTAIALSGTTVAENQPGGTVVGSLSSTDADVPAQTFTYALVNGSGDADNGAFSLQDNTLRTAVSFDFETKASYTIRVRTTDSGTPAQSYETSFTIAVSNRNELTVNRASQTNVSCNGGSNGTATVTVSGETGPYTYDWSPGTPTGDGTATIQGVAAGTYSVLVTAANGFTATTSALITQPAPVVVTISPASTAVCGGTVQLTANTAATSPSFVWTGTTPTTGASVEVTSTGVYSVTLTDSQGCQATATTSVTVNAVPSPTLVSSGELSCTTPTVTLTAGGGTRYAFSGGANPIGGSTGNTATVTSPGLYSVTVSSAEGCTSTTSVMVSQNVSQPSVSLNPTSGVLTCTNPTLTLRATSPVSDLRWSTGATGTSIPVSVAGTYSVTATGTNGCQSTASASITSDQALPIVQITPSSATLTCANPSATLAVTGGGSIVWSTGSTQPQIIVSTAGVYSVSVTAANGCQGTTQASIEADFTLAAPPLTASSLSTSGEPISVTATGCAGTLSWLSQGGTGSAVGSIYTFTQPGNYTLSATCTVGTCTSPAAPSLALQIRPGGFAITGVSPVSCQLLDAGRGQYEVRFTPQYAGVSGTIRFAVVNELASTTAPGPYALRLYSDNPMITLVATQSGSPEARFVYHWLAACSVGTPPNRPPVARTIPDQTLPQGQAFSLELTDYITDPDGQPLTFSASGLPADLSLNGSRISGTAATTGVSTIAVTALDPAGLQVTATYRLTVTPVISTPAGFTIVGVTTVSCQTLSVGQREIRFLPQYGGLNGQPITFQVANELTPTTQAGPYTLRLYTDNPIISLQAAQSGSAAPATFRYNWLAGCGAGTTPPPSNGAPVVSSGVSNQTAMVGQGYTLFIPGGTFTDPDGDALTLSATGLPAGLTFSGSTLTGTPATTGVSTVTLTARDPAGLSASLTFILTVLPATSIPPSTDFAITGVNTVQCEVISAGQRRVSFTPQYGGVSGTPISFSVVNELSLTTAPGPYTLSLYTDNPIITLKAQQGSSLASYSYDWLAACNARGRQGVSEMERSLSVRVLGNPVTGDVVRVEVQGAKGQPLQLTLINLQGQVVSERVVERAGLVETQSLSLSAQPAGLLLLRVSTPSQSQILKVLNR
ncbi:putative Ig domain-containing protein, partial [Spirosoma utsteinense]